MLTRRQFLVGGATATVGFALAASGLSFLSRSRKHYYLLLTDGDWTKVPQSPLLTSYTEVGGLSLWTPSEQVTIALPFFGHGITQNPVVPEEVVVIEKWGLKAATVNLKKREMTQLWHAGEKRRFFGHGVFSQKADFLYVSAMDDEKGEGVLSIRDTKNYASVGELPTYGKLPHDCHLSQDGKVLVVVNSGSDLGNPVACNISWIELSTGKLLQQRVPEMQKRSQRLVHCAMANDGWVVGVGTGGAVYAISPDGDSKQLSGFSTMTDTECLSVALLEEKNIVAVTSPFSNRVYFWNYKEQSTLASHEIKFPGGVSLSEDRSYFLVSSISTAKTFAIPVDNLQNLNEQSPIGHGPHITSIWL